MARHPLLLRKRIREVVCGGCGADLEIRYEAVSFHSLGIASSLVLQITGIASVLMVIMGLWGWLAALLGVGLLLEVTKSFVARRFAQVIWINEGSMRRAASGRWVPAS